MAPKTVELVAAVEPTPPAAPPAAPPMSVRFSPVEPDKAKTPGGTMLARVSISGCFGPLPLVISGAALQLRTDRSISVFMPGPQYSRVIGAAKSPIPGGPVVINGRTVTEQDDPAGVAALGKLEDAIRTAWARANSDRDRTFGHDWPLAL